MGLKEYRKKRDFRLTPEPRGQVAPARSAGRFVVQKHAARQLHYDFRLELDGVLKSWAVPKGPSLDPSQKRLAVHVEDHPIEYGGFEGIIPEGEYGGGTVVLWDRGTWTPEGDPHEGYRKGDLKFRLDGEKLKGRFTLVRMARRGNEKRENWLLIKHRDDEARRGKEAEITALQPDSVATRRSLDDIASKRDRVWRSNRASDERAGGTASRRTRSPRAVALALPPGARRAPMPGQIAPELATLVSEVPADEGWIHEIKLDGYRLLGRVDGKNVRVLTRNGNDWTAKFPTLARALGGLRAEQLVVDGEIVRLDAKGRSSFQDLQNALGEGEEPELVFFAFDLLYVNGHDLRPAPLLERKRVLRQLLSGKRGAGRIHFSDHVAGDGERFYRQACRMGLEGIVAKRADSPYRGERTHDWLKVKCGSRQELVIGGFTEPSGSRAGLGSLLLGVYEGPELRYAGRVGTGFSARALLDLRAQLERLERDRSPFAEPPRDVGKRGVHWVQPKLVGEVAFTGWTTDGRLRHPSFQGLREDKPAREVVRESARPRASARSAPASSGDEPSVAGVRLTHPDRILYPEQGLTKIDLARYYEAVSDWILPHIQNRPLTLVRCPQGRAQHCFYQKHVNETAPEQLGTLDIREDKKTGTYLFVHSLGGLIELVQMGVLEMHTWGSTVEDLERPDRLIFDLDPDPAVEWSSVISAARAVRSRLEHLGLESYVKTTGGKGLHVEVPLVPSLGWEELKQFARALAESLVRAEPDAYVATASKAKRRGKIFIDYLRNARGATAITVYSTRARPGAPVATPLRWEELKATVLPDSYTLETVPRRVERLRADPWRGYFEQRQKITRGMFQKITRGMLRKLD